MVATASTEHSYWLALAFLAVFVYTTHATHATQAMAFEWKPGLTGIGHVSYCFSLRHIYIFFQIMCVTSLQTVCVVFVDCIDVKYVGLDKIKQI